MRNGLMCGRFQLGATGARCSLKIQLVYLDLQAGLNNREESAIKAIVQEEYGPPEVLQLREIPTPVPKADEILVRIKAATVTAEDPKQRSMEWPLLMKIPIGIMFGFRKPKIKVLGSEFAGEVSAVGADVVRFAPGDRVFGFTGLTFGAYAEYKCLPESALAAKIPDGMSFDEAAAVPNGALSALVFLSKKGQLQAGEKILIYGASGSVGTAAVQIAKAIGAEVTAVCSQRNIPLMRQLGADHVFDYRQDNWADVADHYDVIFDTVGKTHWRRHRKLLKRDGRYLMTVFGLGEIALMLVGPLFSRQRIIGAASNMSWEHADLEYFKSLYESGKFKPVIDRYFMLEEASQAHAYVEQGHKVGNVVLRVS